MKNALEFALTQMTLPTHSRVICLIPLWLSQLKTLLGEGVINFRILFLKTTIWRVESKLLYSMIEKGKKGFLKKLCLILKQGMLSTFFVAYAWVFSGISLKRYWGLHVLVMSRTRFRVNPHSIVAWMFSCSHLNFRFSACFKQGVP